MTLRTKKTEDIYQKFLAKRKISCIFCARDLFIREFKYWILLQNKFPYDKIASEHYLLATKRHIQEPEEMNKEERTELYQLQKDLDYNMFILNKQSDRSQQHLHFHLIKL